MKYKHVHQIDDSGCGISIISMLSGRKYETIRKLAIDLKICKCKCNLGTHISDLRKLGKKYNIGFKRGKKSNGWKNIPSTSVVRTNIGRVSGESHWVLLVKEKNKFFILDPGRKYRRITDFRGRQRGDYWEVMKTLVKIC